MGTNSMEICIKIRAPVSTKRAPVRRLTGALFFWKSPRGQKINLSPAWEGMYSIPIALKKITTVRATM